MSLGKHRLLRKDGYPILSGSVVESDPTPTGSFLAQNTATQTTPGPPPSGIPLLPSSVLEGLSTSTSTSTTQSSSPTASLSASASSGDQISMATVIGSCIAALIALLLSVLLAFYCSKRHKKLTAYAASRNNFSRRRSLLEPWKRIHDGGDSNEGQEQFVKQRPLSGPLGAMFHRTISNSSGGKSSVGHNRESVGTMQNFVKYHPGLAAEMASQDAVKGVDRETIIAKPAPVLRLMGRRSDMTPISLDGDTDGTNSFSLHSSLSNSMSHMMATQRSTPPAVTSSLHHWECAEVLHVPDLSDPGELQNPFSDNASSVKSSPKSENPFFSARDHPVKRTLLPDTHENPFTDTNAFSDSSQAIRSLIAALQVPEEQSKDRIVSVQSSVYSHMTADDADSAISVTAFPSPPGQIEPR